MKSLHLWHTHTQMNHLYFFLIQKSCVLDRAPSCWYRSLKAGTIRNGTAGVKQSKAAEFQEDPPTLRTCVALKWSPDLYVIYAWLMSPRIQTQTCSSKRNLIVLAERASKGTYLHAHLAFQPSSLLQVSFETVMELWLQILLFYSCIYSGVIKSGLLTCDEGKQ